MFRSFGAKKLTGLGVLEEPYLVYWWLTREFIGLKNQMFHENNHNAPDQVMYHAQRLPSIQVVYVLADRLIGFEQDVDSAMSRLGNELPSQLACREVFTVLTDMSGDNRD